MNDHVEGFDGYGADHKGGREGMIREFHMDQGESDVLRAAVCVVASYTYENYEGSAHALVLHASGRIEECEASHCSCNGLEGLWGGTEVTPEYIEQRVAKLADEHSYYIPQGEYRTHMLRLAQMARGIKAGVM